MKQLTISDNPGVLYGVENNSSLFIRNVKFDTSYIEGNFHNHPNSFEFYIVLSGQLQFETKESTITAKARDIIYFEEGELHKVSAIHEDTEMLLIKKLGSDKKTGLK